MHVTPIVRFYIKFFVNQNNVFLKKIKITVRRLKIDNRRGLNL